jgi:hypothetical protein
MKPLAPLTLVAALLTAACASSGPVVPTPPAVRVSRFGSTVFTPDKIRFEGQVVIENRMRGPLDIESVDYGADLHDAPLFEENFAALHPMRSRGTQTVTLPFQVAMRDVAAQAEDVLAEEALRVRLRGVVHPVGFGAIPFEATQVIPIPKMPGVSLDGTQGNPLDGELIVFLRVDNPNDFGLLFQEVDTFLTLNGKRYDLLRTESFSEVAPGGSGRIALTMRETRGKSSSMLVNVVKRGQAEFTVGGSLACRTPYGLVLLPLELASD